MMRILLSGICLLFITGVQVEAQTNTPSGSAADYFNIGSATFIRENPEAALGIVNEGLSLYPQDESLQRLKKMLEEKKDEQPQQNQQNQDQEDQSENQPEASPENQDEESQQENRDPSSNPESRAGEAEDQKEAADDTTRNEAEMVLDSLRQLEQAQREQIMREMIRRKIPDMPPVEKDW